MSNPNEDVQRPRIAGTTHLYVPKAQYEAVAAERDSLQSRLAASEWKLADAQLQYETYKQVATDAALALGVAPGPDKEWVNIRAVEAEARLAAIAGIEKLVSNEWLKKEVEMKDISESQRAAFRELQQRRAAAEGGKND